MTQRERNDECRSTFTYCHLVLTPEFVALPTDTLLKALRGVREFNDWARGDTEHHAYGTFEVDGYVVEWTITENGRHPILTIGLL